MRKKVDDRIRTLIENGVKTRNRSMFVIIGDKSRDQIVNLHYMLSKAVIKSRPTVSWCYKEKLVLSSHKRERTKQVKKLMQRGLLDPEKVDPFSLFLGSGAISYCLYRESDRILGNTYGMCILQDFEALTPNILARTIETVEGGGLVVLLLRSLSSLSSLCTMIWARMEIWRRLRGGFCVCVVYASVGVCMLFSAFYGFCWQFFAVIWVYHAVCAVAAAFGAPCVCVEKIN